MTDTIIEDAPYASNRHLGPFAKIDQMQFMGIFHGKSLPPAMYPHEQYLQHTHAKVLNELGVFPIYIINRLCLN